MVYLNSFIALLISVAVTVGVAAAPVEVPLHDGYKLVGEIQQASALKGSVLLLHQCNRDQKMWAPLVALLNERGYSTMTVDARGFGESKSTDFDISLSDEEYVKAVSHFPKDAHSIYDTWKANTPDAGARAIVGASCGGAMASTLAGAYTDIEALALFSPALRAFWFGEELWAPLHARAEMPILGIVSIEDKNSLIGVERAVNASKAERTEFIRYNGRRHGEPLFTFDPSLAHKMAIWIDGALK